MRKKKRFPNLKSALAAVAVGVSAALVLLAMGVNSTSLADTQESTALGDSPKPHLWEGGLTPQEENRIATHVRQEIREKAEAERLRRIQERKQEELSQWKKEYKLVKRKRAALTKKYHAEQKLYEDSSINIASYNVCSQFCPKLEKWPNRSKKVGDRLKASGADIILIQELGTKKNRDLLLAALGPEYGVAIGEHSKMIAYKRDRFSHLTEDGRPMYRKAVSLKHGKWAVIAQVRNTKTNQLFKIANVHFLVDRDKPRVREEQFHIVMGALENVSGLPIVGGDFNSYGTGHKKDKARYGVHDVALAYGYSDTVDLTENRVNYNLASAQHVGALKNRIGRHLDHIYIKENWKVESWEMTGNDRLSDHRMIRTTFFTKSPPPPLNLPSLPKRPH